MEKLTHRLRIDMQALLSRKKKKVSTPAAPPTLTVSTDKASYSPGDTVTLSATYTDSQTETLTVNVTASATDSLGQSVSANTSFSVVTVAPEPMTVSVSDDGNHTWTQASDDGNGNVTFTTTA